MCYSIFRAPQLLLLHRNIQEKKKTIIIGGPYATLYLEMHQSPEVKF